MEKRDGYKSDRNRDRNNLDSRGPSDSREVARRKRRLAKIRRRQRKNLLIIIAIIAIITIVLVSYGIKAIFGKKTPNDTRTPSANHSTEIDETPSSETETRVKPVGDEKRVFFNTPNELIYVGKSSISEKNVPQEGESPTRTSYGEQFSKDMFFGDSIMDILSFYNYIYKENSVAKIGLNTNSALEEIDKVVARKPENVYMLFGINDIKTGLDAEAFISRYKNLIDKIKEEVPDVNIFIQSITPVDESKVTDIKNNNIREYNKALEKLAKDEKATYVDLYKIDYLSDYHLNDGVQFNPEFGDAWARFLLKETKGIEIQEL